MTKFYTYDHVCDQVQIASALLSCQKSKDVCSKTTVMASVTVALDDLPDEILPKILSHFGAEELSLIIPKVCKWWNILAKDVSPWKTVLYKCDHSSDTSHIAEVRCTTVLEFRTNNLTNFAPSSVLKVKNVKKHFRNSTPFHPN